MPGCKGCGCQSQPTPSPPHDHSRPSPGCVPAPPTGHTATNIHQQQRQLSSTNSLYFSHCTVWLPQEPSKQKLTRRFFNAVQHSATAFKAAHEVYDDTGPLLSMTNTLPSSRRFGAFWDRPLMLCCILTLPAPVLNSEQMCHFTMP